MMTKIKKPQKCLVAVVVLGALVALMPTCSFAAKAPRDPVTLQALAIDHIGAKVCRSLQSATAVSCTTSSGMLYELCAFGTSVTVGKGAMAFDTGSEVANGNPGFQASYGISPIVYGTGPSGNTGPDAWVPRCWKPIRPVRFENGLGIQGDSATISVMAVYRLDSGVNP